MGNRLRPGRLSMDIRRLGIRQLAQVTSVALLVGLLAACGGDSTEDEASEGVPAQAQSPAEDAGSGSAAPPDSGGEPAPGLAVVSPDDALFANLPAQGRVALTLQAHEKARLGQPLQVRAHVPFPRGVLSDASQVRVVDAAGQAIPAQVRALLSWHSPDGASAAGVRVVEVAFAWTPVDTEAQTLYLAYGVAPVPAASLPAWRTVAIEESGFFPLEYSGDDDITEPEVFVTLSPRWLGASLLRGRTLALDAAAALPGFDGVQPAFGRTAVNDVRDHVTEENLINYQGEYAPWLFDRAGTLWNLYLRTGELKWFRHAWRATQFYRDQVKDSGYFALKSYPDLKYSYNLSLFIGYALTGDESLTAPIEQVAATAANDSFNPRYSSTLNFWTERHLAYSVLASLVAWELTGQFAYLDRVNGIIATNLAQTRTPDSGEDAIGCILHTVVQHEGGGVDSDRSACSPWMMALYGEVLWRAYLVGANTDALQQLSLFGDYLVSHGTYVSQGTKASLDGRTFPYYLAGPDYDAVTYGVSDEWTDQEHACDVAALGYRSAYAKKLGGESHVAVMETAGALAETCLWVVPLWIRTTQATVDAGKTFYRLAPPRKFNWWFGSTSEMSWMIGRL